MLSIQNVWPKIQVNGLQRSRFRRFICIFFTKVYIPFPSKMKCWPYNIGCNQNDCQLQTVLLLYRKIEGNSCIQYRVQYFNQGNIGHIHNSIKRQNFQRDKFYLKGSTIHFTLLHRVIIYTDKYLSYRHTWISLIYAIIVCIWQISKSVIKK